MFWSFKRKKKPEIAKLRSVSYGTTLLDSAYGFQLLNPHRQSHPKISPAGSQLMRPFTFLRLVLPTAYDRLSQRCSTRETDHQRAVICSIKLETISNSFYITRVDWEYPDDVES